MQAKLFTQGNIAVIVDQSCAPKTAKLARGVAHTSSMIIFVHPARALDWVPKRKKNIFCIFPFLLSYYPHNGPHAAKSETAVTYIQIILYYSTLVQKNVSLLQSFRDECVWYVRDGDSREILLEIFAVVIILSPISSVCGIFRVRDECILQCVQYARHLCMQHTCVCNTLVFATHCVYCSVCRTQHTVIFRVGGECISQCIAVCNTPCVFLGVCVVVQCDLRVCVLQRVAACCSVLQRVAVSRSDKHTNLERRWDPRHCIYLSSWVSGRCMLQRVAACCSVLQRVAVINTQILNDAEMQDIASTFQIELVVGVCCSATYHNTLQHSATHCNTLQHTATHRNALQHTAPHCNTLQHTTTHCNTLQHTTTHCSPLQHAAAHYNTLLHTTTRYCTLQHTASSSMERIRLPKIHELVLFYIAPAILVQNRHKDADFRLIEPDSYPEQRLYNQSPFESWQCVACCCSVMQCVAV